MTYCFSESVPVHTVCSQQHWTCDMALSDDYLRIWVSVLLRAESTDKDSFIP